MNKWMVIGLGAWLVLGTTAYALDNLKAMVAVELDGKGEVNKLVDFNLTNGANAVLHGYVPKENDTIELYVKDVLCDEPDKQCSFEVAMRKKESN